MRAVPDRGRMEPAWRKLRLTVQIATKLNRSHSIHGEIAYLLPCLGRIEIDQQASGPQAVSVEDSTACIHGSRGMQPPASAASAVGAGDRRRPRKGHAAAQSEDRLGRLGRPITRRSATRSPRPIRRFSTASTSACGSPAASTVRSPRGTANGRPRPARPISSRRSSLTPIPTRCRAIVMCCSLITLRSNDQFNTTIYGYDDRFRGIHGTRMVVLMHRNDIDRLAIAGGRSG